MWMPKTEAPLLRMTNEHIQTAFVRDEINFPFPEEGTNTMWYRPWRSTSNCGMCNCYISDWNRSLKQI